MRTVIFKNKKLTIAEFSKVNNLRTATVHMQLNRGWSVAQILDGSRPKPSSQRVLFGDRSFESPAEFGRYLGVPTNTVCNWFKRGWSIEKMIKKANKLKLIARLLNK